MLFFIAQIMHTVLVIEVTRLADQELSVSGLSTSSRALTFLELSGRRYSEILIWIACNCALLLK